MNNRVMLCEGMKRIIFDWGFPPYSRRLICEGESDVGAKFARLESTVYQNL